MKKNRQLNVRGKKITVTTINEQDFICLTDMVRGEESRDHIRNWMRNRNTVEFLGLWETIHNPDFKGVEFDTFRKEAGLNNFNLTPKKWIKATSAVGIVSKAGKYGGTYAHRDIAYEFGTWFSPEFKLYLIKEFDRLKKIENDQNRIEWDHRRLLSKINYKLQTDAVQKKLIPHTPLPENKHGIIYAQEAELLNVALFGMTSRDWKKQNGTKALGGLNIRDGASIAELIVLNNLEQLNALMIEAGLEQKERLEKLSSIAKNQLSTYENDYRIQKIEDSSV